MLEACAAAVGAAPALVEAALRVVPEGRALLRRDVDFAYGDDQASDDTHAHAANAVSASASANASDDLEAEIANALAHTLTPRVGDSDHASMSRAAAAAAAAARALTDAGAAAREAASRAARTAVHLAGSGGLCDVLAANDGGAAAACATQLQRIVDQQVALAVGDAEAARMRQLTSELAVQSRQLTQWADARARALAQRTLCPAAAAAAARGVHAIPAPHAAAGSPTSLGWAAPLAEWAARTGAIDAVGALLSDGPRAAAVRAVAAAVASAALGAAMGRRFDERGGLRLQAGVRSACSLLEEALPGSGTLRSEFAPCFQAARLLALPSLADAGTGEQQQQQEGGLDGEQRRKVLALRVDFRVPPPSHAQG